MLVFGLYTAVKAAFLSTVFSTLVEERNLIYLAPLLFVATALAFQRRRLNLWAVAASAGFVLYVILTTHYQLDWPYFEALGFGIVQMANRDLAFDVGDIKILLSVVLVISLALLLLPGLGVVARRRWAVAGITATAVGLLLAWNVAGEVSASNGVNVFSRNLLEQLPDAADLDRRCHRRKADDLPRPEDHRPGGHLADGVLEPRHDVRVEPRRDGAAPGPPGARVRHAGRRA